MIDQAVLWLSWEVLHHDPCRPFFHRHNDLTSQWGGPNVDNVYRHARIEPGRRYRIRGRMHSCDNFVLALRRGFMHSEVWGTVETLSAGDRGLGPGDEFELLIGGDEPGALPLAEGVVMVSIREFYFHWLADEPAVFTIECLDPDPIAAAPSSDHAMSGSSARDLPEPLATRVDAAFGQMHDSLSYWRSYMESNRGDRMENSFSTDALTVAKGLSLARYEFCFWSLAPHEALVIECDVPDAEYWGAQLYRMETFEPVDLWDAIVSRNHTQTTIAGDGRIYWVLAAQDPGTVNWIDTNGRDTGLCTIRWFWPQSDARPSPSTTLMAQADVAGFIPDDLLPVSAAERARELQSRRDHLRWRFRV